MALNEGDVQPLVVGVVSHRNLLPAEIDAIRLRVRELLGGLQRDHPQLPLVVVSALADGGDQLVAEEALALGARLVAPLPFARGDYARDFAAGEPRARFERLCEQATVLEPTLEALRPHGAGAPARTPAWHYARAGVFIASHCHLLLALWDGKPSDLPGGTAQIVAYYRGGKLPRLIERRHANARANPLDEDGGHLLCHLVCSRDAADGVPRAPLAPLQFIWHAGEETGVGVHAMPTAGRAMCRRIAAFNLDHVMRRAINRSDFA